jgi:AcrR family transcriptional regulator
LSIRRRTEKTARRLGREDWLARALKALETEGVAGVRVESLARSLGVTKGSFYWHFKDRDDLLESLLDYWANEVNTKVIEENRASGGDARARLRHLMRSITERELTRYDLAVRAWAVFDPRAAGAAKQSDEQRYAYVKGLFHEIGFRGSPLELRTRLFMHYQIAEPILFLKHSAAERRKLLKLRHEFLTRR